MTQKNLNKVARINILLWELECRKAKACTLEGLTAWLQLCRDANGDRIGSLTEMQTIIVKKLFKAWKRGLRVNVRAPFGSGKTFILTAFIAWCVGQDHNDRWIFISVKDEIARERLRVIKKYIKEDKTFRRIFPDCRPNYATWAETRIEVHRDINSPTPTVSANGIDTAGIGQRGHVIFDDGSDIKDAQSKKTRESRVQLMREIWLSRIDAGAMGGAISTPWHSEDAMAKLEEEYKDESGLTIPGWETYYFAINDDLTRLKSWAVNDDGYKKQTHPLPPWFGGKAGLLQKKRDLGTNGFQRGMQMLAVDVGSTLIKPEWIHRRKILDDQVYTMWGGFDSAWGKRETITSTEPANSAIEIVLEDKQGKFIVVEDLQSTESPEAMWDLAIDTWHRWRQKPNIIEGQFAFEVIGGQYYLYDQLIKRMRARKILIPFVKYKQTVNKSARFAGLVPYFERAEIAFLEGIVKVVNQALVFPHGGKVDGLDSLEMTISKAINKPFIGGYGKPVF